MAAKLLIVPTLLMVFPLFPLEQKKRKTSRDPLLRHIHAEFPELSEVSLKTLGTVGTVGTALIS